jgi:hypothetical protein
MANDQGARSGPILSATRLGRCAARVLAGLIVALGLPGGALAATGTVSVPGSATMTVTGALTGCPVMVPALYNYGALPFTTGASAASYAFNLTGFDLPPNPPGAILLYPDGSFDSSNPATNLTACADVPGTGVPPGDPLAPRLVVSLAASTTYTLVVIKPVTAFPGPEPDMIASLELGVEPTITGFADTTVAFGATGQFMPLASSSSPTTLGYTPQNPFVALVDVASRAITTVGAGATYVAAIQAAETGTWVPGTPTFGSGVSIKTLTVTSPAITSATYDAATGVLAVTATGMTTGDTIDPSKLTLSGEASGTYTLTTSSVTAASATSFSVTLNATDKTQVDLLLNKNGTSSNDATTYNLAAADLWDNTTKGAADLTGNGVTVSNVGGAASCSIAFTQAGYSVSSCGAGTASGTSCTASCGAGYTGTVAGSVSCSNGSYSGTFSGCTPAACSSAYTQTGYAVTGCGAGTASGTSCAATCASGYTGTAAGSVSCSLGAYSGTFSGCSPAPATSVTAVAISASPLTASTATTMTVAFTPTTALVTGDTITVKLAGYTFTAGPVTITKGTGFDAGVTLAGAAAPPDTVVATLGGTGGATAGTAVTLTFPATNPAAIGAIAAAGLTVATSKDTTPVASSAGFTIIAPVAVSFTTQPALGSATTSSITVTFTASGAGDNVRVGALAAGSAAPTAAQVIAGNNANNRGTPAAKTATTGSAQQMTITGLTAGTSYDIYAALETSNVLSTKLTASTATPPPPDYCAPNPCQNGSTCTSGPTSAICSCTAGYTGAVCEIPPPTSVTAVTISASPLTASTAATMTVDFRATTALASGDTITVNLTDFIVAAAPVVTPVSGFTGSSLVGVFSSNALVVTLGAGTTVAAGASARFTIPVTNPVAKTIAKAGLTVRTSKDTTAVASSADIVIAAASLSGVKFTVSPATAGSSAIMTVEFTQMGAAMSNGDRITIGYTDFVVPTSGLTVTSATGFSTGATFAAAATGGTISITVTGTLAVGTKASLSFPVTNPAPKTVAKAGLTVSTSQVTTAVASSTDIAILPQSAVTAVTISASPLYPAFAATATVDFKATTALGTGDTITVDLARIAVLAGGVITPVSGFTGSALTGTYSSTTLVVALGAGTSVAAGASVRFTFPVINPASAQTIAKAGLTVKTSKDTIPVASSADIVIADPSLSGVNFTVSPATANSSATMTVEFTQSGAAMPSGSVITIGYTDFVVPASGLTVTSATGFSTGATFTANATSGTVAITVTGTLAAGTKASLSFPVTNPAAKTVAKAGLTVKTEQVTTAVASSADIVIVGPTKKLRFVNPPLFATVNTDFSLSVAPYTGDAIDTASTNTVTLTSAPAGLTGTTGVAAVKGTAGFSGLRFAAAGTYSITASATGYASDTISVVVQQAATGTAKLMFLLPPPSTLESGTRFDLSVKIADASGNVFATGSNSSATVTISSSGGQSVLRRNLVASAVGGVATFKDLYFEGGGGGTTTLTASAPGVTSATSTAITVTRPTKFSYLAFATSPSFETTNVAFGSAPVVKAFAADGTVFTAMTGNATLSASAATGTTTTPDLGTATTGASLTQGFSAGVATFPNVKVTAASGTYVLTATAGALSASTNFNIYADASAASTARATEQAQSNRFTVSFTIDASVCAGASCDPLKNLLKADFCTAASLTAQECARISVTVSNSISSAFHTGTSDPKSGSAAKESCPAVVTAVGEVTVPPCMYGAPGTYWLEATSPGFPTKTSNPFTVVDSLEGNLPSAPRNLKVETGDGQAVVSWDPPETAGAGRIVTYEVFGLRDGVADQSLAKGLLTSKTLKLANGTEWRFGVKALNSLGGGEMARSSLVRIGAPPAASKVMPVARLTEGRTDGQCGAAARSASTVAPTEGLCETGAAGGMAVRHGAWKWTCEGVLGGRAASCSTDVTAAVVALGAAPDALLASNAAPKLATGGCKLQQAQVVAVGPEEGPGTGAVMLYGATGLELVDCPAGVANVTIGYPGVVQDMQMYMLVNGRWEMLNPKLSALVVKGDTANFSVADNGPFDADPQVGVISIVAGVGYIQDWLPERPEAPQNVTAVAGIGTVTVSWTAPAGGGTPVRYRAVANPGDASCVAEPPATSCTIAGLAGGTSYTFTVIAENATGASASGTVTSAFDESVKTVITGFYQTILGRSPGQADLDYWAGEAARAKGLGADVREVFFAMATAFFSSPEYVGRNTSDAQFITDVYRTFFNRTPDASGLAYWQGELTVSGSRSALLNSFLFSAEFSSQMTTLFGVTAVRPEVTLATDLFRGVLGRLPDSAGFDYWLGQIRAAQCSGASAVSAKVNEVAGLFFNSGEYLARSRSDRDFIGDVYNAYMRRGPGGDTSGFNYWVGRVPALGRDGVRAQFVPSAEFQSRVTAVVNAGCIP